jgi:hypothetical protein
LFNYLKKSDAISLFCLFSRFKLENKYAISKALSLKLMSFSIFDLKLRLKPENLLNKKFQDEHAF